MRMLPALALLLAVPQEGADPGDLLRRLDDDRLEVREAAEEALGASDPGILPRLRAELPSLKGEARERLASTIRRLEHRARLLQILPRPALATIPDASVPFRGAFEALRKQLRVPLVLGEDLEGLDRNVRPSPGRATTWEVLDRLLAAHGAASLEVNEGELKVVRGARRLGTHRGAHAVWIQGLTSDEERVYTEPAAITSCLVQLAAAWEPGGALPVRVRARLVEAVDGKALPLLDPEVEEEWVSAFTVGAKTPWQVLELPLSAAPSAEAASIARLRTRVEFHYPLERAEFRIDVGSGGRRQAASAGWTLHLLQLRTDDGPWTAHLRLTGTPEEGQEILVESAKLTDKDGTAHEGIFPFEVPEDDDGNLEVNVSFPHLSSKIEPRRLEVKLITRMHAEVVDLDLKDVPLAGP